MRILSVDSSAKACSAAVLQDGKIIGSFFINTALTHSRTLVPMMDAVLKNTNTPIESIDAYAVSAGPGSFTGVRIGVAAIKGAAYVHGKPCVSVSTLEAMAYNLLCENCVAVCVMDARCNQVYNALFRISDGRVERLCDDRAMSVDDLARELETYSERLILVGDGAQLFHNAYKDLKGLELAPENVRYQNAAGVGLAAEGKPMITAAELMPVYLRLPQAERELKKRMENKQ